MHGVTSGVSCIDINSHQPMDVVRDDPELASELVIILGKELKVAKKNIEDLKSELQVARRGGVS